jgi:hypothetical protein
MAIETGIQPPVRKRAVVTSFGTEIDLSKTLDEIQVDQSFVLDTAKMRTYALKRGHDKEVKLTSEKTEEGRYRIWRTA